jgi:hypothetical protein
MQFIQNPFSKNELADKIKAVLEMNNPAPVQMS